MQAETQPDLRTKLLAGRYELSKVVGRGGMGTVWEAEDVKLQRKIAVKLLSSHLAAKPGVKERFETEARSAARLSHPNVVSVYDTGEQEGISFIVMELLSGRTLADSLKQGPMSSHEVIEWSHQALAGIQAAHRAGIVHRDIKPGNILFAHGDSQVKVADFGIAKGAEVLDMTETGTLLGTPSYIAPERVAGQPATPATDLYSLAVVMYEALTGGKAFEAESVLALAHRIQNEQAAPLRDLRPDVDPGLAAVIERAMDKDPARRFAEAEEMAGALAAVKSRAPDDPTVATALAGPGAADHTQVLAVPADYRQDAAAPAAISQWGPGRLAAAIAAVILILAVLFFAAVLMNGSRKPDARSSPSPAPSARNTSRAEVPRAPAPAITTPPPTTQAPVEEPPQAPQEPAPETPPLNDNPAPPNNAPPGQDAVLPPSIQ